MNHRERILRVVLDILGNPYHYRKKDLSAKYCGSERSKCLEKDFEILNKLDLLHRKVVGKHVYAIIPHSEFSELRELQPLNEEDWAMLSRALNYMSSKEADTLKRKLRGVLDYQKLGLEVLRKPSIDKLHLLAAGISRKLAVRLVNYRSGNSNTVKTRLVEPVRADAGLDTLQAFELTDGRNENRHFRISRIGWVELTDQPFGAGNDRRLQATDCFRIVNDEQIQVHLTLKPRAYNNLLEQFPAASKDLRPDGADAWDLQTHVNRNFYGILPFILANFETVTIHYPEALKAAVRKAGLAVAKRF